MGLTFRAPGGRSIGRVSCTVDTTAGLLTPLPVDFVDIDLLLEGGSQSLLEAIE